MTDRLIVTGAHRYRGKMMKAGDEYESPGTAWTRLAKAMKWADVAPVGQDAPVEPLDASTLEAAPREDEPAPKKTAAKKTAAKKSGRKYSTRHLTAG